VENKPSLITNRAENRLWQVDAFRGLAILGMILYHSAFSLFFFGKYPIPIFNWKWELLQTVVAGSFLLLVGVSLSLKKRKLLSQKKSSQEIFFSFLRQAGKIFAAGLLITLVTWITLPDYFIRFGVLHLIGTGIVLAFPLLSHPKLAAFVGGSILLLPWLFPEPLPPGNTFTLWLGFVPENFRSLDYFPVIPWFGLIALGTVVGAQIRRAPSRNPVPWLTWIGTHSLAIYLLHQPVLLFLIWIVSLWR
jgi:uncharacterized membrane protein